MGQGRTGQFNELAKYYDVINDRKDYRAESARLRALASRFGGRGRKSWLDVGCGTGRHLDHLRRTHPVVGLDASREMLRLARRRLPGVRLVLGDMRSFRLDERFDVVSCLYGAIGHLATGSDVRRAFRNFARHLTPDGVVLVEPWVDRSAWRSGWIDLRTHRGPDLTVVRCGFSSRRRDRWVLRWHFLIGERGRPILHLEVTDTGLLARRATLLSWMREAGLESRFVSRGLTPGRGILVGVKRGSSG